MSNYHIKYSSTTKSLQSLKHFLTQIVSIGKLTDSDILSIRYWMDDNMHLSGNYPFDKIYSIIDEILSDGVIEPEEQQMLLSILQNEKIYDSAPFTIQTLAGYHVCLTGNFIFDKRKNIEDLLPQYCAFIEKGVNLKTDYVFVGGAGSNDWAYGNYGSKIKRAKELQEQGHRILIFSEDILKQFLETHTPQPTYTYEQCLDVLNFLPEDVQKIIQNEINSVINGIAGSVYVHNQTIDMLIEKNILCIDKSEYASQKILKYISRNELNRRIEALNLGLSFNKNLKQENLVIWCFDNIPDHIKDLFPDIMLLKLNESFLNPKVLIRLQQHLSAKFPPEY